MTNDIDSILDDVQKICIDVEVFVSYSHSDLHLVRPLLQALTDMDYSIWIDNAVDLGIEWEDHVAKHIYNCTRKGIFVSVIIDQYIDSENCMDELYYAVKRGARIIPVIIGNP